MNKKMAFKQTKIETSREEDKIQFPDKAINRLTVNTLANIQFLIKC